MWHSPARTILLNGVPLEPQKVCAGGLDLREQQHVARVDTPFNKVRAGLQSEQVRVYQLVGQGRCLKDLPAEADIGWGIRYGDMSPNPLLKNLLAGQRRANHSLTASQKGRKSGQQTSGLSQIKRRLKNWATWKRGHVAAKVKNPLRQAKKLSRRELPTVLAGLGNRTLRSLR